MSLITAYHRFVYHTLAGWTIEDRRSAPLPRFIVVVAPHTSNWDFFVGLSVRILSGMQGTKFLGKKSLFRFPLGIFFRALGGYPVDRSRHNNLVDAVVALFNSGAVNRIAITPEGTRASQPHWKSGFHHIATKAGIPIILCAFDYANKRVVISDPFPLTTDVEGDIERMKDWFRPFKGRHPENGIR
jgi:1-acyl-sn-glycerol-3-phosphate acyltransferase